LGNWIKVDVDTPYKPAIGAIMERTGCGRGDAFLAWFNLYVWFDQITADGRVACTKADIDAKAGVPGTAGALEDAGWLSFVGGGCQIVNWYEHNGKSARARAVRAKCMAGLRTRRAKQPAPPVRDKKRDNCVTNS